MISSLKKLLNSLMSDEGDEKVELDESDYGFKPQKRKDNEDEPGV